MQDQQINLLENKDSFALAKDLISNCKNIYLVPSPNLEAVSASLALFYNLKKQNKNVNFLLQNFPPSLKFLLPSLDFLSYPKNFVIAIPQQKALVSRISYEKDEDSLKIFLTLEKGTLKKEDILFYFSEDKPDLTITIGIKNYSQELIKNLNPFGFLLDSPILNIDSSLQKSEENKKFGKINLIEEKTLGEIVFSLIKNPENNLLPKETANALMTSLIISTNNFKEKISPEVFEISAFLLKSGANFTEIVSYLKS